jgi:vancomycin permeability regulator SanA
MTIENPMRVRALAVAALVIALAALLMVDGILSYLGNELFSLPIDKLLIGIILVVLGASYLERAQK